MSKKDQFPTETLTVTIDHVDYQGRGVVKYRHPAPEGQLGKQLTLFIPNTVPGDVVEVTVPNAKGRRKAVREFDRLVQAGPTRNPLITVEPKTAGGTPLLVMDYEAQLRYKEELIKGYFAEQGLDPELVAPIIGMADPYHYRNKMELTFGANGAIGMHQQGNYRQVIDLTDSPIAPQIMIDVKQLVSRWQSMYNLPSFEKESKEGLLMNLMMRYSRANDELMVVIYASEPVEHYPEAVVALVDQLTDRFPNLASLQWAVRAREGDERGYQATFKVLAGRDYINDQLGAYHYRLWPNTFFQVNPEQAECLVNTALEMASVDDLMRVVDLYCGVGTFSLPFADRAGALAGIEIVPESIESAKRNAQDNGVTNADFFVGDARKGLLKLQEEWGQPDLLVLDPPRSGAGGKAMRAIGRLGTEQVVYISCGPKALAEDLVWLQQFGYEIERVQPIDQFPHTVHVEACVSLRKRAKGEV